MILIKMGETLEMKHAKYIEKQLDFYDRMGVSNKDIELNLEQRFKNYNIEKNGEYRDMKIIFYPMVVSGIIMTIIELFIG